ncbi:hypothetical protein ASU31_00190 [Pedobacter ginsenosidimutans]|uniref:O-antigen ligase-related domain-containing protein n=1 Tax=Pedobacter ginsenosidimutans TaxID=687842 RepID=A0A0T5VVB1_9SPHI|nr:O-antigen ligase family protein [Pedobacter ginsenosidimutans]KRT17752.1 hypothetical protein ASU31_00190 [Pedobacter ginsenosidimutans]
MSGYFSSEGTFLLYGILSGVLLQACWGLLQYLTLSPVYIGRSGIQGGFINPGIYGCFMAVGLIIIIHLITIYKGTKPGLIFLITTTMLVLAALIFSLSRTAYIAALLGTGILLSPRLDFKCHVWFMRFRFLLLGAFIIAFIGLFYYLWQRNTLSVSGRFLIWKISFRMFMDYPVFGIGYGNFFTEYGNYQAAYFQSGNGTLQEVKTAGLNYYPFNELLKVAVENGIIGLALFLWMLILCIRSWSRIKAKYPHLIVFISMLIVIMIFGMFSYPLQSDAINCVFYFSIAAIASFQMSLYTFNFNRIKKISMLIPVILLFGLSMRKINALNDWRKAQSSMVYAEGDALRKYEKIYHVLDNNGAFLFNYGALLADMNVNDKSLNILTSAQRYLSNPKLATILAIIYNRMQNYGKAERYYLSCAYMEPKRFVPFNTLLVFYRNTGQTFKAQNIARKIIDKPVKIPSLRISEIKNAARQYLFVSQNDKPPLLNKK